MTLVNSLSAVEYQYTLVVHGGAADLPAAGDREALLRDGEHGSCRAVALGGGVGHVRGPLATS